MAGQQNLGAGRAYTWGGFYPEPDHTVADITMTDPENPTPGKINALTCSCGKTFRAESAELLAEAYAFHTGVTTGGDK